MHDYLSAALGGALIGIAGLFVMMVQGKIMGISGILSRLLPPADDDWAWRALFVTGVIVTPIAWWGLSGSSPTIEITAGAPLLALAGGIVGVGTVIGNGCTSGHGVCGVSRLSPRSLVATGLFMTSAIVTVAAKTHLWGG